MIVAGHQQSILEKLIKYGDEDEGDILVFVAMVTMLDKICRQNSQREFTAVFEGCLNVAGAAYEKNRRYSSGLILIDAKKRGEGQ